VKERLKSEILAILAAKDKLTDPAAIGRLESLVPRGMIFGPARYRIGELVLRGEDREDLGLQALLTVP